MHYIARGRVTAPKPVLVRGRNSRIHTMDTLLYFTVSVSGRESFIWEAHFTRKGPTPQNMAMFALSFVKCQVDFGVQYLILSMSLFLILSFLSGSLLASRKDYWFFPKNSALNWKTIFFYKDTFLESLTSLDWLLFPTENELSGSRNSEWNSHITIFRY